MDERSSEKKATTSEIHNEVDNYYRDIAEGKAGVRVSSDTLYRSLGYDESILKELPEEVRLGLSCGNPLENLVLKKGMTLLDLGCGAGMDVFITRIKFPEAGTLYGVDRLPEMIARAERARDKKGFRNIEFRQGTLTDLPFEDGSMDRIISNCVINLEPDKEGVYKEIFRVLKDDGMFIVSDIVLKGPLPEYMKDAPNLYGT